MFNAKSVNVTTAIDAAEEFQLLDTSAIQIRSVIQFMDALTYKFNYTTGCFETQTREVKHISKLSFNTAVRLHNLYLVPGSTMTQHGFWAPAGCGYRSAEFIDLVVSPELMAKAQASKIVKTAKIQKDRKGNIHIQSMMVEFPNADYARRYNLGL
ncbi:hypothetical protein EPA3_033 [Pseudomonas phage vB_PaM_EPA3]|nr:hypothetical protein EPA3_033 [Pseudomonas phage vB_PaM_EPA3]